MGFIYIISFFFSFKYLRGVVKPLNPGVQTTDELSQLAPRSKILTLRFLRQRFSNLTWAIGLRICDRVSDLLDNS